MTRLRDALKNAQRVPRNPKMHRDPWGDTGGRQSLWEGELAKQGRSGGAFAVPAPRQAPAPRLQVESGQTGEFRIPVAVDSALLVEIFQQ